MTAEKWRYSHSVSLHWTRFPSTDLSAGIKTGWWRIVNTDDTHRYREHNALGKTEVLEQFRFLPRTRNRLPFREWRHYLSRGVFGRRPSRATTTMYDTTTIESTALNHELRTEVQYYDESATASGDVWR